MSRRSTKQTAAAIVLAVVAAAVVVAVRIHDPASVPTIGAGVEAAATPTPAPSVSASGSAAGAGAWRLVQEPDDGMASIDAVLTGATKTLTVTMYELQDAAVVDDLVAAERRGVQVRVLLDAAYNGRTANAAAYRTLTAADVPVRWEPAGTIVHQKTITADAGTAAAVTAVGTANLQSQYYADTLDAWVLDTDRPQVAAIAGTFDADWAAAPENRLGTAVQASGLLWSPDAETTYIADVDAATTSVQVSSEELGDSDVLTALEQRARAGVACQVLLTDQSEWRSAFTALTAAGCTVRTDPDTSTALYVHEKQLLVDGRSVLIGSQNIGVESLTRNRELSVTVTDPVVVAAAEQAFAVRFDAATAWTD